MWKAIKGYEGDYEVSDNGEVRSLTKEFECFSKKNNGMQKRTRNGRILKQDRQNAGYCVVWLSKNGKVKAYTVHRLVAEAFIDNNNNCYCVNHKNGDKTDNRAVNLEWCTSSENLKHAYDNLNRVHRKGTKVKCEDLGIDFMSIKEASQKLNVNANSIVNCLAGRVKHAGGYKWSVVN